MPDDNAALGQLTVRCWTLDVGRSAFSSADVAQILPIPRRRDAFPGRVGAGLIGARRNALLTQLAHVPVLPIYHVPEFDRVLRPEVLPLKSLGVEKPIAQDQRPRWRLWLQLMYHHVVRMQTQQHVWKNGIIKNEAEIFVAEISHRQRACAAAHRQALVARDPHQAAKERSFG